ncbi:MAG: hypothetical protein ACI4VP_06870, partial [Clostridia bacterium]
YDLAGNVYEWTMEAYSSTYRVGRGGFCNVGGGGGRYPASGRSGNAPTGCNDGLGFRPALYIS